MTLRTRLGVLAAVILAVAVGVVGVVFSQTSADALMEPIDTRLQRLGDGFVDNGAPGPPIREDAGTDARPRPEGRDTAMIRFVDGTVTERLSSGFESDPDVLPSVKSSIASDLSDGQWKLVDLESVDGSLRFRAVAIVTSGADEVGGVNVDPGSRVVTVFAQPLESVSNTIERLRLTALATGVLALIAGAASVWWVVRVAFRPVDEMVVTAERIGSGDLSLRVPEPEQLHELKTLGTAINSMLRRIESAREAEVAARSALTHFVADASHELRTPIAAISGHVELVESGALDEEASRRSMSRITAETSRMSRLVEDLLTLASHDSGHSREHRSVNLSGVLADALEDRMATDRSRTFESEVEPSLFVEGDERQLFQVATNLLANVSAHTPPGSTASIKGRLVDGEVVVDVRDDGPGVGEGHRSTLFERFARAHTASDARGAGLGLAIVAALVEEHGGTVEALPVESGAHFQVRIPAV